MDADNFSAQQPIQHRPVGSWASTGIDYFDSKTRLLAIESKEVSQGFVGLLMLVGVTLVLASLSIRIHGAFPLYLVSLLPHLAWDWSAMISVVILSLVCVGAFLLLRLRPRRPVFRMMLQDLEKDKQWLRQSKTKSY